MPELHGRISSVSWRDDFSGETLARIAPRGENPRKISYPFKGRFAHGFIEGETVTLRGEWTTDPDHGKLFQVSEVERTPPTTREGEVIFLSGYIKGLTKKNARKLLDKFGSLDEVIRVCRREPQKLDEVMPRARKVKARLRNASWDREEVDIDMFVALQSAGLRNTQIQELVKFFGARSLRQVAQTNPYRFCQVPNVGFASAEKVANFYANAQGRGIDQFHEDRLLYGIRDVVGREQGYGHVCAPEERIIEQTCKYLKLPQNDESHQQVKEALSEAIQRKLVIKDYEMIYPRGLHKAESDLSLHINKMLASHGGALMKKKKEVLQELEETTLSDEQRDAVATMATEPISLLVGGPGRGKTWTLQTFVQLLEDHDKSYKIMAPTGKAAKRAQEVTGKTCYTIHKGCNLEHSENVHDKRYGRRLRQEDWLKADVIIVDEASMIDLALGFELVRRVKPGKTSLILVGDPNQLPPVGAGQVLKDLLKAEQIPVSRLTKVFRQGEGSAIVTGADQINDGEVPDFHADVHEMRMFDPTRAPGYPKQARKQEQEDYEVQCIHSWLIQALKRYTQDLDLDPLHDIQVYAPQRSGPLGLQELNPTLQKLLNPTSQSSDPAHLKIHGGFPAREGDKVMQVQNNYRLRRTGIDRATKKKERSWSRVSEVEEIDERMSVMNGQVGEIITLDPQKSEIIVQFEDIEEPILYLRSREWHQLSPAYAISIHKAQGSETPYAFIVMHDYMHPRLVSRPLIYTAWTRAQKGVAVFSTPTALKRAVDNTEDAYRYSNLYNRIEEMNPGSTSGSIKMFGG